MHEFLIKQFRVFLLCHLFITVDTVIIGQMLDPSAHLTYRSMCGPLILAAFCVLPSFIMYCKEELSIRQIIIRRLLQVILIEAIVLIFLHLMDSIKNLGATVIVAVSVLIVYGLVWAVDWIFGWMEAKTLNRYLKQLKKEG